MVSLVAIARLSYGKALSQYLIARGITAQQLQNGAVSPAVLDEARAFAIEQAKRNMNKAAADLDFLAAAKYRDEMWALQQYLKVWKV